MLSGKKLIDGTRQETDSSIGQVRCLPDSVFNLIDF